jgi:hypothetical protein
LRAETHKEGFEFIPNLYNEAYGMLNMKENLEILVDKIKFMSDIVEEPLAPTYSYVRLYKNNGKLLKHVDRPSCEISVTAHLGSDGTEWKFGIEKPNKEEVILNLLPGQAIIYLGCIAPHWREKKYQGENYGQLFLHYVKIYGSNWKHYFDRLAFTDNMYTRDLN